jgi:membrane-bound metal-dependent hydrolase YbcI (DUF457 family)
MDPITHGIAGSLLGKSFFAKRNRRVAVFAATLGAVFPDIDTVADFATRDPLAIVKYHRGITHSLFALPFFAAVLAWITRRLAPRFGFDPPSTPMLSLIYGVGIASHVIMDGTTSFGTRMWAPFSNRRVAWDLIFIIDLTFTSILLAPQVAAWIYSDPARSRARAIRMCIAFIFGAVAGWGVALLSGFPFHAWIIPIASAAVAALFFLPGLRGSAGWGFQITHAQWCRAGVFAALAYVCVCGVAHHAAMQRVRDFARHNHLSIERIGALPLAPSLLAWGAGIRTSDGVYQSQFDLRHANDFSFRYFPDSSPSPDIARAMSLPDVRIFWQFSRFPSVHARQQDGTYVVDIGENRYMNRGGGPQPFTYRVVFDGAGQIIEEGMTADGMFLRRMRREASAAEGSASPSSNPNLGPGEAR